MSGQTVAIAIKGLTFDPRTTTVLSGDAVYFENKNDFAVMVTMTVNVEVGANARSVVLPINGILGDSHSIKASRTDQLVEADDVGDPMESSINVGKGGRGPA